MPGAVEDVKPEDPSPSNDPAHATGDQPISPVEELRKRFVGEEAPSQEHIEDPQPEVEDPAPDPTDEAEVEPEAVEDPEPEVAPTPEPEVPEDDPYGDELSEDDRKALGQRATKRIKTLHAKEREAREQLIALQSQVDANDSHVKVGQYFNGLIDQHHLAPEDVDTAMNLAVGLATNPGQTIPVLEQILDGAYQTAGIAKPEVQSAPVPYAGALPQEYQDLVDVYGMDERRVRLLAGFEAAPATPAPPPAPPTPPPAPAPVAAPQPQHVDPMPRAADQQALQEAHALSVAQITTYLMEQGIKEADMTAHIDTNLGPIMAKFAPGGDPRNLSFESRLKAVQLAHEQYRLATRPVRQTPPRDPAPVGGSGGGNGRAPEPPAEGILAALRARLVGPE